VDVGKPSTAESDFIAVAKILGRSVESVHDALQVLASIKQSWLLVLDNADDPNFDYQAYLPSGTHGAVIMTSRVSECRRYSPDTTEALEGLEDGDSRELLLKAAEIPQESWPSHISQAEEVVRLLGSHTLALLQAGAYVAQGHCQLHQYPKVYRQQRQWLLKYKPKQAQSRYCDIYATFEASAEVLEQSESEAAKDALCLLAVLSMLDSSALPLQIFEKAWYGGRKVLGISAEETGDMDAMSRSHVLRLPSFMVAESDEWDPYRLVEASSLLVSLSLATRHDLDGLPGLSMHALTHVWAKDRQELAQQGEAWVAAGCVLALSQSNAHMWQIQERRLLPHIQSYLDIEIGRVLSFGSEATIIPILLNCGSALLDMRRDSRLNRLLDDMFVELGKNPEEASAESLPLYELRARSLLNLGKHKKAVELLEQVVKIRETTLAADHSDRLTSQYVLAGAYEANGQVKEAVKILEQVVEIEKTTLTADHPSRLASQHELALAYQTNGQVKEAVEILEQVVKIKKTTLIADHPSRLASQHALACAYQANGQVKQAVELLEQVVKINQLKWHKDHPSRVVSEQALAYFLQLA
jgi:tetratricopeptide (TPR) repeat protein